MLSIKNADDCRVIVLDEVDLLRLREGPLGTPDGKILFAVAPDLPWTAAAFEEAEALGGLSTEKILSILATARVKE